MAARECPSRFLAICFSSRVLNRTNTARTGRVLRRAVEEFIRDDGPASAAALSYYAVFALPPLLVVVTAIAGLVVGESDARARVVGDLSSLVGAEVAGQLSTMVEAARARTAGGIWATIAAFAGLLIAATGVFVQLQVALNRAWEIRPDPDRGSLGNFFSKRLSSFVVILCAASLVLASLVLGAVVSGAGSEVAEFLPGRLSRAVVGGLDLGAALVMYVLIFSLIFMYLPDARIRWRDVLVGAAVTAVLFAVGRFFFGLYLGRGDPGSIYGTAASIVLIMIWVYYSSMILLVGAEFTQAWAREFGAPVVPDAGAIRVVREEKRIDPSSPE